MPTVDILLATYNGEKYIAEQIESIQNQTFTDWRLLVSDDGSTDNTLDIVRTFQKNDARIELVPEHEPTGSSTSNFLYLLKQSTAPYAMFCDQDDVWLSEKIEHTLAKMKETEKVKSKPIAVFSDSVVVNETLEVIEPSFMNTMHFKPDNYTLYKALVNNICQGSTMMLNKALISRVNAMGILDAYPQHDYWAAVIALSEGSLLYLNEQTLLYRQHGNNAVGASPVLTSTNRFKSILKTVVSVSWSKNMSLSETEYFERASGLLESKLHLDVKSLEALNDVVESGEKNFRTGIKVLKKYRMFKEISLYKKCYQIVGIFFFYIRA